MPLLVAVGDRFEREIKTHTREDRPIKNTQVLETVTNFTKSSDDDQLKEYSPIAVRTDGPAPHYNCHGLTFAGRRTGITESQSILDVLREDGYQEVKSSEILPGDVIVYFGEDNDVEHSGVVLQVAGKEIKIPVVLSKWGRGSECVHLANRCPYSMSKCRFYRVKG